MSTYIFSSESVGEGHPDKVADTISDAILDACLALDPKSRVACETFVKSNVVVVGGEITIPKLQDKKKGTTKPLDEAINIGKIIRDAVRGIGYTNEDDVFHADTLFINNYLDRPKPRHRARRGCCRSRWQEAQGAGRWRPRHHVRLCLR